MRYPRIYDLNLRCTGELRTAEITDLKLKDTPLSCMTVTVPTKDIGSFGYRQFVEIFDAAGKRVDLFRVTEIPKGVYGRAGTKKLKCDQVLLYAFGRYHADLHADWRQRAAAGKLHPAGAGVPADGALEAGALRLCDAL